MKIEPSNMKKNKKKKVRESINVTKELSHVILKLYNVTIELSNVRKKIREPLNVIKELSYVMLKLHNVTMESSNARKK